MRLAILLLISLFYFSPLSLFATPLSCTDNKEAQGLHLDWLDNKIDPAKNFFAFANGQWQKNNPIPDAYARWGSFTVLRVQNDEFIHKIIKSIAENNHNKSGSNEQKIGDFYFSGMDEATINTIGIKPLQPEFDRINHIQNLSDLQKTIAHLQTIGAQTPFSFGKMQDFEDSRKVIGVAVQDGLSLPDRDYYLKNDARFKQIRLIYLNHVTKMFELLGDNPQQAANEANIVLNIETTLAKASMPRTEQRDPHAIYHPMTIDQLQRITPHFSWAQYFNDIGHPELTQINFATPNFFKVMDQQINQVTLDHWKTFLRWHLISSFAPFLSTSFVNENFRMNSSITGVNKLLPRWQRVVAAEDGTLGFAIGKLYVEKSFPPSSKKMAQEILANVRLAMKNDLQNLAWMTPETRKAALIKLDKMRERIGYPNQWRDYSALEINRGPYILNIIHANEFLYKRELNKIGKPVDENEWEMTPQTVNAYYNPSRNELNIPAGILQSPFFDPHAPAAVNYGAIGWVMGHEMTHGFDDEGAQFDANGNVKNWWTPDDLKKFKAATQSIVKQFSQYHINGLHLQGKLVAGEAAADLAGLNLAYRAYHASDAYQPAKTICGFSPDQQFFIGTAHVDAINIRPDEARLMVLVDPHPPGLYRINGTLVNMPQFQQAFGMANNSPMVSKHPIVIW